MATLKLINNSHHPAPAYETEQSAGMDVRAFLSERMIIDPLDRALIPTGLFFEIPEGYEMQVRPRSGLAIKHGITLLNAPGTIDADYRGELKIILCNISNKQFAVEDGMRIAQLVMASVEKMNIQEVKEISETGRGSGGFGHTGNN